MRIWKKKKNEIKISDYKDIIFKEFFFLSISKFTKLFA